MKYRKVLLIFALMFTTLIPMKADVEKSIIIASKQLPYIMYVQVIDEKNMRVNFISRDLILPASCRTEPTPLKKIDLKNEFDCAQQSVENFFDVKSANYVYVHLNRIADDLDLPCKNIDFSKLGNMTDYFGSIVDHMKITTILKYKNYIESDLSLSDYYDYYHMFKGKKVKISYYYVNQMVAGSYTLPMDHTFHKKK